MNEHGVFEIHDNGSPLRDATGKIVRFFSRIRAERFRPVTYIDDESRCPDYGRFSRFALARHGRTGELVRCRADLPDTAFSIPATTKTEDGFLCVDNGELVFTPHTIQATSPAEYRRSVRRARR